MAFNGSGTHVRVHDWTTDLTNVVPVTASRMDAEHDDMSTALSTTICRDGQSTTTARIPFAAGTSAAAGTTASVSYSQTNDNNTGLYFPATDQWGLVAGGTATLTSTSTGISVVVTLSPSSSDGAALGTSSLMWSDVFLASGAVVNFNNGDVTLTHAANALNIAGGTVTFDTAPTPATSDAAALGTASVMWADLFLASGGVINFNNGDVTITHSANALAFAGGAYSFDATVTINGGLVLAGNFAINTDKFTVAAASGNTVVAGTLAVTGASTLTGALTANNTAGVTGRNLPKAFVTFTTDGSSVITELEKFNVTSVGLQSVGGQNGFRVTFTSALPSANYAVSPLIVNSGTITALCGMGSRTADRATTTFDFVALNAVSGVFRADANISLVFYDNA